MAKGTMDFNPFEGKLLAEEDTDVLREEVHALARP